MSQVIAFYAEAPHSLHSLTAISSAMRPQEHYLQCKRFKNHRKFVDKSRIFFLFSVQNCINLFHAKSLFLSEIIKIISNTHNTNGNQKDAI